MFGGHLTKYVIQFVASNIEVIRGSVDKEEGSNLWYEIFHFLPCKMASGSTLKSLKICVYLFARVFWHEERPSPV